MTATTRLRRALDLDKAPASRREIILWGLVGACLILNPDVAHRALGALAGLGALGLALLRARAGVP